MAKYITKTNLIHNNVEFPVKTIIELGPEDAKPLLENGVIETTREEIPANQEIKNIDIFSAPSSVAEIEKAVDSAILVPIKRAKCPKCKVEREVRNAEAFQNDKGILRLIGNCAICGTKISRISGKITIEKKEE